MPEKNRSSGIGEHKHDQASHVRLTQTQYVLLSLTNEILRADRRDSAQSVPRPVPWASMGVGVTFHRVARLVRLCRALPQGFLLRTMLEPLVQDGRDRTRQVAEGAPEATVFEVHDMPFIAFYYLLLLFMYEKYVCLRWAVDCTGQHNVWPSQFCFRFRFVCAWELPLILFATGFLHSQPPKHYQYPGPSAVQLPDCRNGFRTSSEFMTSNWSLCCLAVVAGQK